MQMILQRQPSADGAKPTRDEVASLLDYDAQTGVFTWKFRDDASQNAWNAKWAGKRAGTILTTGYRQIKILGGLRLAHRLA